MERDSLRDGSILGCFEWEGLCGALTIAREQARPYRRGLRLGLNQVTGQCRGEIRWLENRTTETFLMLRRARHACNFSTSEC